MRRASEKEGDFDTVGISIHALHEESDDVLRLSTINSIISIHALHEESDDVFLHGGLEVGISIHALHEESERHALRAF